MKLTVKPYAMSGSVNNYMVIHPSTATQLDLDPGSLVQIEQKHQGFQIITSNFIEQDVAGISPEIIENLNLEVGANLHFKPTGVEGVTRIIRKKMKKNSLEKEEVRIFMEAIERGLLTDGHIGAFGTAVEINGMSSDETTYVAESILEFSKKLVHDSSTKVVDKHSIGGIAGNRITPLMIPIIAAANLTIPKVSTRAITSPAGTADALEVVMPVELTLSEAQEVIAKTGACMVDGLRIGLGSTADKFLRVVKQIKIDPQEMMIASILAKKKAAGSQHVLIDLPTGPGSKLPTREDARKLAFRFASIGNKLGLKIESVISPGDQPIGTMIGPSLEITEALQILQQDGGAHSLRRKALSLSGLILEMAGKTERGNGYDLAKSILNSGKSYEKFKEIAVAQGSTMDNISWKEVPEASYTHTIKSEGGDKVYAVNSFNIGLMARAAGAPSDHLAGVVLHVDRGAVVEEGDPLITIHASSENKIDQAIGIMRTAQPLVMERAILEHIPSVVE